DPELTRLLRIWMANRGIWEALPGAGPTVPVPAGFAEVDRYVTAYTELLGEAGRQQSRRTVEPSWNELPSGRSKADQLALAAEYRAFTAPRLAWLTEE